MTYDLRNPEPSRPTMRTAGMIVIVLVAIYVIVHWPEISSLGPIHTVMTALGLQ
jgi:hypothetical protein